MTPPKPRRRLKVPFVAQMEAVECGAACLTMALHAYRSFTPLAEVRAACGIARDGVTALGLVKAARALGLQPRARKLEPAQLVEVACPAILHWQMNHFVLLTGVRGGFAELHDPAIGPRRVDADELDRSFTGVCIELPPGPELRPRARDRAALRRWFGLLREVRPALVMLGVVSLGVSLLGLTVPLATQVIVDRVLGEGQTGWLAPVGAVGLALTALLLLTALLRGWLIDRARRHLDARTTCLIVDHLLRLPHDFFLQRDAGDLLLRVEAVQRVRDVVAGQAVAALVDGALLLGYLALIAAHAGAVGLVAALGCAATLGIAVLARRRLDRAFREVLAREIKQYARQLQIVEGVAAIKAGGGEDEAMRGWLHAFDRALDGRAVAMRTQDRIAVAVELCAALTAAAALAVAGAQALAGALTPGGLLVVILLVAATLGPVAQIADLVARAQELPALLAQLDDVLQAAPEASGAERAPALTGRIELVDVDYAYGRNAAPVLKGLSLAIGRGEKVALVGPSGAGKSTVARLLLGLCAPTAGSVRFDGRDLRTLELGSVRRQIGAVLQETHLFEGTIRDNIALGSPGASLPEVVAAARAAQLHADILALPRGYDTPIRDTSCPLSGGQRQRLALARAILARPPILVLDEATSALDTATEAAIERYLATHRCTRVIIAHRLSTVRDADRIVVLDRGAVVESGSHDELVARGGLYARLVARGAPAAAAPKPPPPTPALGRFPALALLGPDARAALAPLLQLRTCSEGQALLQQGERGGLHLIERGALSAIVEEPGLPPSVMGEVAVGSLVGELGAIDGAPSSATLVARGEVVAWRLPQAMFDELKARRDPLAAELLRALGASLCRRLRLETEQRRALGGADQPPPTPTTAAAAALERTIADTSLGAALDAAEREALLALAERRVLAAGEPLVRAGEPGSHSFLVLAGRIAVRLPGQTDPLAVVRAGELLGEVGFFDGGPRTADAVALAPCVVLALGHRELGAGLVAGSTLAWKVVAHLAHSLARVYRLSNLRLREALALARGEAELAARARERAASLAVEDEHSDMSPGTLPFVQADELCPAPAACLTAVLRRLGRPVRRAEVAEACAGPPDEPPARALVRAARRFGCAARPLLLDAADLAYARDPLILLWQDGRCVAVDRCARGRVGGVEPARGPVSLPLAALRADPPAVAVEVAVEVDAPGLAPHLRHAWARLRGPLHTALVAAALAYLAALVAPAATAAVVGEALPAGDRGLLALLVVAVVAVALGQAGLALLRDRGLRFARVHLDRALLAGMMQHLLRLPIAFFERHPPGDVMQRFLSLQAVRSLVGSEGLAAAVDGALGLAALLVLAAAAPPMLPWALGGAALTALVLAPTVRALRRLTDVQVEAAGRQRSRLLELLRGLVTLRLYGAAELALRRWWPAAAAAQDAAARQDALHVGALAALDAVRAAALLGMTWHGAAAVLRGELGLAALLVGVGVAAAVLASLRAVAAQALAAARVVGALAEVRRTLAEPREQPDGLRLPPGRLRGQISLSGVSFAYAPGGPPVLSDISIEIPAGAKVAIVGCSGSGKSTLGKLLLGFYAPQSGQIAFDGRDLTQLDLPALRAQLGVVLQHEHLFAGPIRDNLAVGAPGAPFAELVRACKQAAIHGDISRMPMQYETVLASGGANLSGGQRQRLALARALVRRPAVLLLDEATSALDNASQAEIEAALSGLGCTRVLVAHRLSTVADADLILVLERGRLVEQGAHVELAARRGAYWRLIAAEAG